MDQLNSHLISQQFEQIMDSLSKVIDLTESQTLVHISQNQLKDMYEKECLTDFQFIIGHNSQRKRVHRLILAINGCKLMIENNDNNNNTITISDVKTESFKALMDCFYLRNHINLTKDNVKDMIKLCQILKNKQLLAKCFAFRWKLEMENMINDLKHLNNDLEITETDGTQESMDKTKIVDQNKSINNTKELVNEMQIINNTKADINQNQINTNKRSDLKKWIPIEALNRPLKKMRLNEESINESIDSIDSIVNEAENEEMIDKSSFDENSVGIGIQLEYGVCKLIRCHINNDDPKEKVQNSCKVNVWKSLFMPKVLNKNENNLIVTCGGCVAAIIDCDNSKVIDTFQSPINEEFFSIAVTVLPVKRDDLTKEMCYVIAIGGEYSIYLCKEHNYSVSYEVLLGFEDAVYSVVFDSSTPNWLFSAAFRSVRIWEIGSLNRQNGVIKHTDSAIIYKYSADFDLISLCFIPKYDCLIASGSSSDILFFKEISSLKPTIGKVCVGRKVASISGLAYVQNSNFIAIRTSFSEKIIIADFVAILDRLQERVMRSSDRKTGLDRSKPIVVSFMKWSELNHSKPTEDLTFMYLTENCGIIACGDHNGDVFLYDSKKILKNKVLEPTNKLKWPSVETVEDKQAMVLSVAISNDSKYLVSTTSTNLVCIWSRSNQ